MRIFRGFLLIFAALLALPAVVKAQATTPDPVFEAAVARLRASIENGKMLPSDPSFYAETLHTSHDWDTGQMVKAGDLAKVVSTAFPVYVKTNGITKMELTRFVASGDTVVAAVLLTGQKPNGAPTRFTMAWFFRLANGKIVDIQEWYDRLERDQRAYAP